MRHGVETLGRERTGHRAGQGYRELIAEADPELVIEAIWYRLLFRSAPLTDQFGTELVRQIFRGVKA